MSGNLTPGLNTPTPPPAFAPPPGAPVLPSAPTGAPAMPATPTAPSTGLINAAPPPTAPATGTAPGAPPPVSSYTPQTATATQATATGYDPNAFVVKPEQTTSDQIAHIIAEGSPLMQQAQANARNLMNQRGLINSSIGITADQGALYSAATPIATADANTYAAAATNTTNAQNAALAAKASASNAASLTNAQLGTSNSEFNAAAGNTAGSQAAAAANTLQQTLQQIAGSKDVATIQTSSAQAVAKIQSDTSLTAQDKLDQTNQILANIQANTSLTNTDKANASAQIIAQLSASTQLSAADKQTASAQIIARMQQDASLSIQDKQDQTSQIIANINASTSMSNQDKQDVTTLAVQGSQTALQTYLGDLSADTQKTLQQKSADASAALAAANNVSAQVIASINSNTSLSVAQQQTDTQKIIAQANDQNAVAVQKMQNDAALDNIKANGQINTAIQQLTNDNKTLLQTSAGAGQLYNQALTNLASIMTNPNLSTDQQAAALNNGVATLKDGLTALASIAGNQQVSSTLNFGAPPGGTTPTPTAALSSDAISGAFQQYLGRPPTATDIANWSSNSASASDLSTYLQNSQEGKNFAASTAPPNAQAITGLYQQYLGRAPTAADLQGVSGQSAQQITNELATSQEAKNFQATTAASNASAIASAFQTSLGRAPTQADLQYYLGQIANGTPASALAQQIASSPDAQKYKASQTATPAPGATTSPGALQGSGGVPAGLINNAPAAGPDPTTTLGATYLINNLAQNTPTPPDPTAVIAQMYQKYLTPAVGRPASADDIAYFAGHLSSMSLYQVAQLMQTQAANLAP